MRWTASAAEATTGRAAPCRPQPIGEQPLHPVGCHAEALGDRRRRHRVGWRRRRARPRRAPRPGGRRPPPPAARRPRPPRRTRPAARPRSHRATASSRVPAPGLLVQLGQLAAQRHPTGRRRGPRAGRPACGPVGAGPRRARPCAAPPPARPAVRPGRRPCAAGSPRSRTGPTGPAGRCRPGRPPRRTGRARPRRRRPASNASGDEPRARIGEAGHAGVAHDRDDLARPHPVEQVGPPRPARCGRPGATSFGARTPRWCSSRPVRRVSSQATTDGHGERLGGARRQVAQVADRRADQHEPAGAGHGTMRREASPAPGSGSAHCGPRARRRRTTPQEAKAPSGASITRRAAQQQLPRPTGWHRDDPQHRARLRRRRPRRSRSACRWCAPLGPAAPGRRRPCRARAVRRRRSVACAGDAGARQHRGARRPATPSQRSPGSRSTGAAIRSDVEAELDDVAVGDLVVLALDAEDAGVAGLRPRADARAARPSGSVSARMKPRSKSVWITPAPCGAFEPARKVQARVSFSPVVRKVRRPSIW